MNRIRSGVWRPALIGTVVVTVATAGMATAAATVDAPVAAAETPVSAAVDTYVVQEQPAAAFGTATKLAASSWSTPWHSQIFLRFVLPAPPAGQQVAGARLDLTFQKLTQQPAAVELRAVTDNGWAESITYASRPAIGALLATATVPAQGTTGLSFDVTATVAAGAGARSFALTNPTAESAAVFHSREQGADGPRIVVTYAPATPPTLCGTSFAREGTETWAQALAREEGFFGRMGAVRFFHGGLPPAWPGPLDTGDRTLVVSFKGNARDHAAGVHDAVMRQWFASAPRDRDIYWVYYHEPEDNIRDGEFTAAEYRSAWQRLAGLADAAGNPRLHATQVLMEWTVNPASGRNWRDYYPGDGVLDVLAWDVYNYDPTAEDGVYLAPGTLLDRVVAASAAVGLPFGIAEMGSKIATGDNGTGRAAWVRAMNTYLEQRGSRWNLWFDHSWPSGDYRLRDAAGVAAWRDLCA